MFCSTRIEPATTAVATTDDITTPYNALGKLVYAIRLGVGFILFLLSSLVLAFLFVLSLWLVQLTNSMAPADLLQLAWLIVLEDIAVPTLCIAALYIVANIILRIVRRFMPRLRRSVRRITRHLRSAARRFKRRIEVLATAASSATAATPRQEHAREEPISRPPDLPPRGPSHPTPGGPSATYAGSSPEIAPHQEVNTHCGPSPRCNNASCFLAHRSRSSSSAHRGRSLSTRYDDYDLAVTRNCGHQLDGVNADIDIVGESGLAERRVGKSEPQKKQKPVLKAQSGMMKAFRSGIANLSKGKKSGSIVRRLMSRSTRSKENLSGTKHDHGAHDDAVVGIVATGGTSIEEEEEEEEEEEASIGPNEEISLGTISTGNVSKEKDDASVGSFISEATFQDGDIQQTVRPSTPWRGLTGGAGRALRSGASSLAKHTASFAKPMSTVVPTLNKKRRSMLTMVGRRFGDFKTKAKQRMASRRRKKERDRRQRDWERRERKRKRREKRDRERDQIFGPGWKWRLLLSLIVSLYPKNWKCRLGERIRKRIGDFVKGVEHPYVTIRSTYDENRLIWRKYFSREVELSTWPAEWPPVQEVVHRFAREEPMKTEDKPRKVDNKMNPELFQEWLVDRGMSRERRRRDLKRRDE